MSEHETPECPNCGEEVDYYELNWSDFTAKPCGCRIDPYD